MTATKPPVPVWAGQVWADTYHGSKGRTVRVVEVHANRATVEVVTMADENLRGRFASNTVGRRSRVIYDHRGLRGYRLVTDAQSDADEVST